MGFFVFVFEISFNSKLLEASPFHNHRQAAAAYFELGRYLNEMKEQRETEIQQNLAVSSNKAESIPGVPDISFWSERTKANI